MAKKDDAPKTRPGRNPPKPAAQRAATDIGGSDDPDGYIDPLLQNPLIRAIEAERAQLLQAYSLLKCLYETLLYAEEEDAVLHADVANVAAKLIDESVTRLDLVRLAPMIEALSRTAERNTTASDPPRSEEKPDSNLPGTPKVEDRGPANSYIYRVEDRGPARYLS